MKIIDEFIGRKFPQNCGDSLLVLSKKKKIIIFVNLLNILMN